jgi:hypothetical protein
MLSGISNVRCPCLPFIRSTSAWDNNESKGTQTVNAVVLVEIVDSLDDRSESEVKLDATSDNYRWIPVDAARAKADGQDAYIVEALSRLESSSW